MPYNSISPGCFNPDCADRYALELRMEPLFKQGKDGYSGRYIFFENFFVIAGILLGTFGMVQVKWMNIPVLSISYFLFIVYMLVFALRKHLCTRCWYYGKACHCGWGKLAASFYPEGIGNRKLGGVLAGVTWATLMIVPVIVMGFLLYTELSIYRVTIFLLFILVTVVNNVLHCKNCKMRFICPGSAARSA